MKEFICINCNNKFIRRKVKNRPQLFCSRKCYLSSKYYSNIQRKRMLKVCQKLENNYNWKGDNIGYKSIHMWIERKYGYDKNKKCKICNSIKCLNWSNLSREYKRERNDWMIMCHKCNVNYDWILKKKIKRLKHTPELTNYQIMISRKLKELYEQV